MHSKWGVAFYLVFRILDDEKQKSESYSECVKVKLSWVQFGYIH